MGNIAVGGKYFPIQHNHCIPKAQIKVDDTSDENHTPEVLGDCDVKSWV